MLLVTTMHLQLHSDESLSKIITSTPSDPKLYILNFNLLSLSKILISKLIRAHLSFEATKVVISSTFWLVYNSYSCLY